MSVGTPLFYKNIKVGEVARIRLAKDNQHIDINAFINDKYSHLIKEDSKFWNISGLAANVSPSGVNIKLESLTSLIAGGLLLVLLMKVCNFLTTTPSPSIKASNKVISE
ncbi:MlaD family protein [Psychromonas sp. KJ10-10]|uniref:MlaD family protein n=1 Tax=Psychromonas sp. KJ10-10 TaxID=3391823 RepID=UPI0039B57575